MQDTLKKIIEKHRKRYQRGKGSKLQGIRSLECNFNPNRKWYNPHFHLIVKEKWMAEVIVDEWLKRSKPYYTLRWCKNIQKVDNLEKGLIEIIKYGSKIFTEPDLKNRAKETETTHVYLKALDTILTAMKGKRIFDRFGFNLPQQNSAQRTPAKLLGDFQEWTFDLDTSNWVNTSTGEILSDYKNPSHLRAILANNINCQMC